MVLLPLLSLWRATVRGGRPLEAARPRPPPYHAKREQSPPCREWSVASCTELMML